MGIPGSEAALDSKLSRIATGNAELNKMRTTLLLGGNDINEVGNLNATSGSFAGNVTAQMLTVQQQASINGALAVQGESQFVGKARFNDELILEKLVVEKISADVSREHWLETLPGNHYLANPVCGWE
ncbi:shufflon system plasmid conjugative transfer pilus tip adhesin PilV [Pseudomonas sp. FSL R10-0399]|uniref:shufflon system plasmid conjugative transfer pilus tip adhesin PilV n=1 Tax=Pseudomonas sp. FSL R10-0399 TaxID=2662194 RepID=UPI003531A2D8